MVTLIILLVILCWPEPGESQLSASVLEPPVIAAVAGCGISVQVVSEVGLQLQLAYDGEEYRNVSLNSLGNVEDIRGGRRVRLRYVTSDAVSPEATVMLLPVMRQPVHKDGLVSWEPPSDLCGLEVVGYTINIDGREFNVTPLTLSIESPSGRTFRVMANLNGNLNSTFSPELLLEANLASGLTSHAVPDVVNADVGILNGITTSQPTTVTETTAHVIDTTAHVTETTAHVIDTSIITTSTTEMYASTKSLRSAMVPEECKPPTAVAEFVWSDGVRLALPVVACAEPQWTLLASFSSTTRRCHSQSMCEVSGLKPGQSYTISFAFVTSASSQSAKSEPVTVNTREADGSCTTIGDGKWFVDGPNYDAMSFSVALDTFGRSFNLDNGLTKWTGSQKSHSKTLSKGCRACFAKTAQCITINCLFDCAASSSDPDCKACIRPKCDSTLMDCSGFNEKRMLPPELV